MSKTTQHHVHIDVFYGDRPVHDSERRAISVVREALQRQGISAVLLVNFFLPRGSRQLDLVIITDKRCVIVELKSLDPALPVIATVNGPWQQALPDGSRRAVANRNFYHQAREQAHGLSDLMAVLARAGRVPRSVKKDFYRQIDTVVAIAPRLPAGSTLLKFDYVEAIGLDSLVDYLRQPGRGLTQWDRNDWDELIRELGLYPEADDALEVQRRRADNVAVQDYRRRFRQAVSASLNPLIPASAHTEDAAILLDADTLAAQLADPAGRVLLVGPSGDGKTHTARHTAIRLTDEGRLVVWISADDYRKNDFGVLLSRAVSPYSTERAWALLQKAADSGVGITVIIDALQASTYRTELLNQLNALLLHVPASVLVTASDADAVGGMFSPSARIELRPPQGEEQQRLARAYGSAEGAGESGEYRTRYDVSVAAQVINELPAGAPRADIQDAYIRRVVPNETVRAGLRCLAAAMDSNVTTVLALTDALNVLRRCPALEHDLSIIDDVLAARLLTVQQGKLRFGHERQARFLTAEHLVLSSEDGMKLGQVLCAPAHEDLRRDALILERDPVRRYDAIRQLADHELLAAAAAGMFGADTARTALAEMSELLVHARMATAQADFDEPKDQEFWARGWHCPRAWSHLELAMFRAIGKCVISGLLFDEVGQLLDATDAVLRPRMIRLHEAGHRTSVSTMFASVYAVQHPRAADALPAAYICGTIDTSRMWGKITDTESGYAARMWRPNPSWGRLHVAALLSRPLRHPEDAAGMLDLLRAGWRAGGYHLHLELLEAARFAHRALSAVDRDAVADFLDTLDVSYNIGLSSLLLEVLGLYERIEPIAALDEIYAEIATVIADPSDHGQQAAAAALVSRQYEDERVFGAYGEAVMTLPLDQRLTLFAMAALSPGELLGFGYPDAVSELADNITRTDDLTGRAIAETARRLRTDTFCRQDAVAAHLHALRGWAKVCDKLPHPGPPDDDPAAELLVSIWRMIDNLLFPLLRGDQLPTTTAYFLWKQLQERWGGPAAAILCDIQRVLVPGYNADTTFSPHDLLVTAYPEQIRTLLEWALTHREQVAGWPQPNIAEYLIQTLGKVGVESTAAMLRHYVPDSEIGPAAITAIKAIETRCEAPS